MAKKKEVAVDENLSALLERINRLGSGGANADAVAEIKDLASKCRQEEQTSETEDSGAEA